MQKAALMLSAAAILSAAGSVSAQDESKTVHVILNCSRGTMQVRLFDANGAPLGAPQDVSLRPDKTADVPDLRYVSATERFITTSESRGCVQGVHDTSDGRKADPINVFRMTCSTGDEAKSLDLVLTSDPQATFAIRRQVQKVGPVVSAPNAPCQWSESPIPHGSRLQNFRSDETLIIEAMGEKKHGYLELSRSKVPSRLTWSKAPADVSDGRGPAKFMVAKPCFPGQNGSGCSENAKAIALNSITVELRAP
jgi:hypothetical protein